jgi:large conductance mechanosensitive channel protein
MASIFRQFKNFMKEYSVSGVAVGIVMGIAVRDYAEALVGDFIMPIVNVFIPDTEWADWVVHLGQAKIKAGHLLAASLNFVIICFIIFFFARVVTRASKN